VPEGPAGVARVGFIDTIATMIAGAHDCAAQLLRKALHPAGGEATLCFTGKRARHPRRRGSTALLATRSIMTTSPQTRGRQSALVTEHEELGNEVG
jgi:hypothetical protein